MLRNLLLGGSMFQPLRRPDDETGAGDDETIETKHTDVSLREIAEAAYDKAAEPKDPADDAGAAAAAAPVAKTGKVEGETGADGADDRGDGRTPRGQFAKKPGAAEIKTPQKPAGAAAAAGQEDPAAAAAAQQQAQQGQQPAAGAPAAGQQQQPVKAAPPPGFSVKSKSDWEKVAKQFPHLVEDIAKREAEVSQGFSEYSGLKPFVERAKSQGRTLPDVVAAYTGIEDLIRQDLGSGLMHIAHNAGATQHEAATMFATLASRLGFQGFQQAPGDQNPGGQPGDQNLGAGQQQIEQLFTQAVRPILDRVGKIETTFTSQAEAQQRQRLTAAEQVETTFKTDPANKYYANVEEKITLLLRNGMVQRTGDFAADLKAAYDTACQMVPEVREALINERLESDRAAAQQRAAADADKARKASRSLSPGAPAPGARVPSGKQSSGGDKLRAAAERAYDAHSGAV